MPFVPGRDAQKFTHRKHSNGSWDSVCLPSMNAESAEGNPRLLTCWQDIANYLGKGVRTVQRWELEYGMPVRRPTGISHKGAVIAHARDLDAWMEVQWCERKPKADGNGTSPLGRAELVETARELRSAHRTLMKETSAALALLVESCKKLGIEEGHPSRS